MDLGIFESCGLATDQLHVSAKTIQPITPTIWLVS